MTTSLTKPLIIVSQMELEALIRRVVQETVHNELTRLLRKPDRSILEYWEHEGPEDPVGDEQLLADALMLIQKYEETQEGWKSLEEFEAELAEAEARHELPG
jgi:hypothetical protein